MLFFNTINVGYIVSYSGAHDEGRLSPTYPTWVGGAHDEGGLSLSLLPITSLITSWTIIFYSTMMKGVSYTDIFVK